MKEQKGVNLPVQEELVTTEKFQWSDHGSHSYLCLRNVSSHCSRRSQ